MDAAPFKLIIKTFGHALLTTLMVWLCFAFLFKFFDHYDCSLWVFDCEEFRQNVDYHWLKITESGKLNAVSFYGTGYVIEKLS